MDFEVGSLADMISGSASAKSKGKKVKTSTKIEFQKMETTPVTALKNAGKKRKSVTFSESPKKKNKMMRRDVGASSVIAADQSPNQTSAKRKRPKIKVRSLSAEPEKVSFLSEAEVTEQESRTVFVGNLINTTTKYNLKNLFGKFGEVEAVRLRGAPVADPRTSKRVAIIKGEFHPDRTNLIAYVRFKDTASARKALAANGTVVKEHTIRVDMATSTNKNNEKKAVFVGNVKFTIEEEDLRKVFECCGEIESIRLVRDRKTGMGKGIAFVNFQRTESVELALQYDGVELEKRPLRVARCGTSKKKPRRKKDKKAQVNGTPKNKDKSKKLSNGSFEGKRNGDGPKAKKLKPAPGSTEFQGQEIVDQKKKNVLKKKKKNKSDLKTKKMLSSLHINPKKIKIKPSQ